jgi:hypothetical protein
LGSRDIAERALCSGAIVVGPSKLRVDAQGGIQIANRLRVVPAPEKNFRLARSVQQAGRD